MKNEIPIISQRHPILNHHFKLSKYTEEHQRFLTMFNFQHSQITRIKQLAELLLKNPKTSATSKFDVGKVNSLLKLPLNNRRSFQKNHEQVKSEFTCKIKLPDYLKY